MKRISKKAKSLNEIQNEVEARIETLIAQQMASFEDRLQNLANGMQEKFINEVSRHIGEQFASSFGIDGIPKDALGKTFGQVFSSLLKTS
jgi:hypothetical protein